MKRIYKGVKYIVIFRNGYCITIPYTLYWEFNNRVGDDVLFIYSNSVLQKKKKLLTYSDDDRKLNNEQNL